RITDQRIGMGVVGRDVVIRLYHKPTKIVIELPVTGGATYKQREMAFDALEFLIDCLLEKGMTIDAY
ncbi:hypothetical protein ACI3PL_27415, partial [Lacticaseibacillus paracasei]